MASLFFTCPLPVLWVQSNQQQRFSRQSMIQLNDLRLQKGYNRAVTKRSASQVDAEDALSGESADKASKNPQRTPRRSRKKLSEETSEESPEVMASSVNREEKCAPEAPAENSRKVTRKGRKKVTPLPSPEADSNEKKATKRRTRKKVDTMKDQSVSEKLNNLEPICTNVLDSENEELQLIEDEGEDISFTYSWPPLVCCFGAAQHLFIPSGRPANRLIDHEIHDAMKDTFWSPTKFIRAPGGPSSGVAVALAKIGGRVEFMGKLGDDEYGQTMLYYLNESKVQTRSVKLDNSKPTAVSCMKFTKKGRLRVSCVEPCAEDSFLSSEINIDVLKEAKMFYFNSSSLLNQNLRSTAMQAIKISKKFGGVIFFDLNLPLPLWKSSEETKTFIQEAWNIANIVEVTKQELEFLCGIEPSEKFDTKDNDKSKFIHHKPEVVMQLWHENLKVLFVTNGTSKIHYYTQKDDGCVHGMEDPPITPFTGDMSISGDAIVAALIRMLTVQPHLATDKGYLEHMIKYAINCGVIDQWLHARVCGFPAKEGMDFSVRSITEREYRTVEEPAA
ncbi:fructokinase-like 2, chloroplastic [Phoenix dactylifera]|uniref:Fructokinase-like 2, chloroplastic n=1 Tax=Phoenix dactylifera TaxID=42345 RepID=A0A8B7BI59_PHODC|nr:fructokinase-like 2, chloroplastic [Phoenix dactylifera]